MEVKIDETVFELTNLAILASVAGTIILDPGKIVGYERKNKKRFVFLLSPLLYCT